MGKRLEIDLIYVWRTSDLGLARVIQYLVLCSSNSPYDGLTKRRSFLMEMKVSRISTQEKRHAAMDKITLDTQSMIQ